MKWFGKVGYRIDTSENEFVDTEEYIERDYYGDLVKNYNKKDRSDSTINDEFTINNQIRILADPFMVDNFSKIRYVTFMDSKWKVSSIDVQWPALLLDIGGLFNLEASE